MVNKPAQSEHLELLDEELVPSLALIRQQLSETIELEDWITHAGTPELAIGYLRLFWPPLLEHEGHIVLASGFTPEAFPDFQAAVGNDTQALEQALNTVQLTELFANPEVRADLKHTQLLYVGQSLQQMWEARLALAYPHRRFVVEFAQGDQLDDFSLTFYELRD